MILQAFIDDSYTPGGEFVLGGHIASAEAWANFAKDWEQMLPYGVLNKNNRFHFKMKEMAQTPERLSRVGAFYRIIEEHALMSISCRINIAELKRARERIHVPGLSIDWDFLGNPFMVAFRSLMDMFHSHRSKLAEVVPQDQKVDFIFDNQSEKKIIDAGWDDYIANRPPESKDLYGARPRFEDDNDFLPLQAADLWAWWVREWHEAGAPERMERPDFGTWKEQKSRPKLAISFNEDQHRRCYSKIDEANAGARTDHLRCEVFFPTSGGGTERKITCAKFFSDRAHQHAQIKRRPFGRRFIRVP